jgi:dipeptidyl aminopeptidase/acylaminoacyl peptidase
MEQDIRHSVLYQEAEALYSALRRPGTDSISDAAEISTNGHEAIYTGTLIERLSGSPPTRICLTEFATGATRVLTFGPHTDRSPKYSPDGSAIAFLSDRRGAGNFQLHLLDASSGTSRSTPTVEGWVEYLCWSPDGKRILLGVAGRGADVSSGQGAILSEKVAAHLPSWMPSVERGNEGYRWRRAWIHDLATNRTEPVGPEGLNIWEAAWCGNDKLAAVVSDGPGEGTWYVARLHLLDIATGTSREIYAPQDQLGFPVAAPSGHRLAVVTAICSDRGFIAGDLRLIDTHSGTVREIDTRGVSVSHIEWRTDSKLLLAGHRGYATVTATYDTESDSFREVWASGELTTAGLYAQVAGLGDTGDCVLIGESFLRSPEIAIIRKGQYRTVRLLHDPTSNVLNPAEFTVERLAWSAPDGLEVQGWLLQPEGVGPFPLVMAVHGGPVAHWRPRWLGRGGVPLILLVKHGFAVFLPNPRGSDGRGQDFVRPIVGDMGGADAQDLLSGVDALVSRGIADPDRLGVMGVSYGGFMSAWLITQDPRFRAAIPVAPFTNHVTEHLLSNIPHFEALFLADRWNNPGGSYFMRSPIMHAHRARTPTLNVCGALDRSAPPTEAAQFHSALLENGIESALVTYPEEGHGIRKFPASIDYAARVVGWFEAHLSPGGRMNARITR